MFIQLSNKSSFDTTSINQIEKILLVQNLILDGDKKIPVTDLELDWILRICGHLIFVNPDLSFNIKAVVAFEEQGNNCLITLRNGFTFFLTEAQAQALGAICLGMGHKVVDLNARATELLALGISKDDYQKLG